MTPEGVREVLGNWPWLFVAIALVWPIAHFLYSHRIEALKEDIDRLRARVEDGLVASDSRSPAQTLEPEMAPRVLPDKTQFAAVLSQGPPPSIAENETALTYPPHLDAAPFVSANERTVLGSDGLR
jgi:hypothetical protein